MFADNRKHFFETMEDGIAFIPAATQTTRNRDVDHDFRQDSTFQYLTNFEEPDSIAVFRSLFSEFINQYPKSPTPMANIRNVIRKIL